MGLWERLHPSEEQPAQGEQTVREAVAEARKAAEVWGRPGRCPECGGKGYLDRIDMVGRVMEEHCVDCFHRWTVAESETVKA